MNQNSNLAVFILSHGRPDNVITYETLRKQGYTGKIYIIVDDEDKTINKYKEKYKNEIIVFSKQNNRDCERKLKMSGFLQGDPLTDKECWRKAGVLVELNVRGKQLTLITADLILLGL